jgi:hydroxymethylbilane synthase
MAHLIIGSRGSKLALNQSNMVKTRLEQLHPGLLVGIEVVEARADSEAEAESVESFQAAAETALQTRRVDCVLHNLRELPLELPLEFHLAAISERAEPREALVVRDDWHAATQSIYDLPDAARLGVNNLTRRAQLLALHRDWSLIEMTGPLELRLQQLEAGEVDALIVAASDLHQLGERGRIAALLELHEVLPAASQGALALQSRLEDQRTNLLLEALNHWPTRYATEAERAVLRNLPQERNTVAAALAQIDLRAPIAAGPQLAITALVADATGRRLVRSENHGPLRHGEMLGGELALDLLKNGARELFAQAPVSDYNLIEELFPAQPQAAPPAADAPALDTPTDEPATSELSPASFALAPSTKYNPEVPVFTPDTASEFDIVSTKARKAREQTPLHDRRILIARATRYNIELVNTLETLGAEVVICPTVRASDPASWEPLDKALLHLSWYEWLTFASAPSVDYFFRRFEEVGHRRTEIETRRICAVGTRTAEKLAQAGLQCDLVLDRFTAECLAEAVLKRFGVRERLRGASMLLIASQLLREELRPALDKFGMYVEAVEAYRMALPESGSAEIVTELRTAAFHYVIFNGESSVENLAAVIEPHTLPVYLGTARVLCSNESARDTALSHGLKVHLQPAEANVNALVKMLRDDCLQQEWGGA